MAPRHHYQHTFTTVPNPLGMQGLMARPTTGPESKPPMTSKQAQKLYREATRGPRLSRAEQRRVEREEQDRIRRELDRDRQTSRARELRDRKKEKEQKALAEKRRKGLPLVEPRASQDTISRFVVGRGNGVGRKRDGEGARVGLAVVREEEGGGDGVDENTPPGQVLGTREGKRRRLGEGMEESKREPVKAEVRGVGIPVKGIEHLGGKDVTADEQEPVPGGPPSLGRQVDKGVTEGKDKEGPVSGKKPLETPESEAIKGLTAKLTLEREASPDDRKAGLRSNKPETMPHADPPKVADTAVTVKTYTKPPTAQPSRLGTPNQSTPDAEETRIGTAPDPPPNKTPINKPAQTPTPPPPAVRPPHQQRPPEPAPVQPPSVRKVLQETTNAPNRLGPISAADSTSKFALPHKPSRATPQRQPAAAGPAFKQPKPRTPSAGGLKPQFLPPHVRGSATNSRPTTPNPPTKQPLRNPRDDFYSAPPTSTQLFIMSHIDDLCPSPTQEARELQGDPPAVIQPAKPGPRQQPCVADFKSDRPQQKTRQAARVHTPMAPPPRPTKAEPGRSKPATVALAKPVKLSDALAIPFISTQDLLFSSQDLRDVEAPTTTPSKAADLRGTNKPPQFRRQSVVAQGPPRFSGYPTRTPAQPHTTPKSRPKPPIPGVKQPPAPISADRPRQPVCEQNGDCLESNYLLAEKQSRQNRRSGTPRCPASLEAKDTPPAAAQPRPPTREKPRFFGSSAEVEVMLALNRSRKTHEEEERRRQGARGQPTDMTKKGPVEPIITVSVSQETDYGDAELDSIDFDDLVTATS